MKRAPKPKPSEPLKVWVVDFRSGPQAGGMIAYASKQDADNCARPYNDQRRGTAIVIELPVL